MPGDGAPLVGSGTASGVDQNAAKSLPASSLGRGRAGSAPHVGSLDGGDSTGVRLDGGASVGAGRGRAARRIGSAERSRGRSGAPVIG
jgi:hypothetical protein